MIYHPLVALYPRIEQLKTIRAKKAGAGALRQALSKLPGKRKTLRRKLNAQGGYKTRPTR